jgi:Fe-S cluster biogenesis protein NfuA
MYIVILLACCLFWGSYGLQVQNALRRRHFRVFVSPFQGEGRSGTEQQAGTTEPIPLSIHPSPGDALELTEENVMKVLDEIRPYLKSDGGDVEVVSINLVTRDIEVSLQGACGNCPSSTTTMKMGIERILRENFDNLGEVSAANLTPEHAEAEGGGGGAAARPLITQEVVENTLRSILPAIQGMGGSVAVKSVNQAAAAGEVVVTVTYRGPARLRKGVELVLRDIKGVGSVVVEDADRG